MSPMRCSETMSGPDIKALQHTWDHLGKVDPMWAILTGDPGKLGHGWDKDEFFATGRAEIDALMSELREENITLQTQAALDFGCGLGRLTQALAPHFDAVTGIDIAPSMIDGARAFNQFGERCRYIVNDKPDLRIFADGAFDFVYSTQVLQHMPVEFAKEYIKEFCRVTRKGGIIVFQMPDARPVNVRTRIFHNVMPLIIRFLPMSLVRAYRRLKYRNASRDVIEALPRNVMEMHGLPKDSIVAVLNEAEADAFKVRQNTDVGTTWVNWQYYALKR
jgi:ubiquinone/menaquinone biosynthesis C-methylase UbiE